MGIILKPIDVVDDISQEDFREKYLKPRKPVVIKIWLKMARVPKVDHGLCKRSSR